MAYLDEHRNQTVLHIVTDASVTEQWYDMEKVAQFQEIANQWRIITYRSFSEQRILKGQELLKAVYEHRQYAVKPISVYDYAIRDGELCGFVKELGCCDINGGMGGWKGIRKSVIYFSDAERTLYDYNRFDYTYSTRNDYTYHAYALVPLAKFREIAPEVE